MDIETYAKVDTSSHPLVIVTFQDVASTDQNFNHYLNEMLNCYEKKESIAIVFDATFASIPRLAHQRMQADWLKNNQELMANFCLGTAYVVPNNGIRAVLRMIFLLQKQPVPYELFEDLESAMSWAQLKINGRPRSVE